MLTEKASLHSLLSRNGCEKQFVGSPPTSALCATKLSGNTPTFYGREIFAALRATLKDFIHIDT
jgi:hypothetical protein